MNDEREIFLRLLDGDLTPDEERALRERLADDADMRRRFESVRAVRHSLQTGAAESFAVGFSGRVMRRLDTAGGSDDAMYRALGWVFRRAAIASLIAAVAFGALNMAHYRESDVSASVIESIFGLPTVTLAGALGIETV